MTDRKIKNTYDDGNIPDVDLPSGEDKATSCHRTTTTTKETKKPNYNNVEPLPESERPRKDGPGGN